ncbi:Receptor-like protein 12 [Triticum urartu]|uniref:Receptor-like protein 12 n=1 Tax=Triticum urartu TaxID=4572 RepID=M7Z5H2_TRIUA|nr:Receptor-like protein 12 [Triticum urartu]
MPRMTIHHTSLLLRVVTLGFLVEIQLLAHRSHALSANAGAAQQVPARCRGDQAAALLAVKRSLSFTGSATSGPATTTLPSWREGTDCCRWEGVGCDNVTGMVTALNLPSRNLAGAVPDSIRNLTALEVVLLGSNKLTGPVPLDAHIFPYLTEVDLSNNSFWGTVPASFFTQPTLQRLCLNMNRLSGAIEEFQNPSATLTYVDLSSNQLTGEIPQWIWTNMSSLNLSHNFFTTVGQPPHYVNIMYIDLSFNMLRGATPFPSNGDRLDYSNNKFSSIPQSSFLRFIQINPLLERSGLTTYSVNLANNELSGPIPYSECREQYALRMLDLSGNNLSGSVPPYLLKVATDRFTWESYPWMGQLPQLRLLILRNNNFYGPVSIPPLVEKNSTADYFSRVRIIDLAGNHFNGDLAPDFFKSFKSMVWDPNRTIAEYDDYTTVSAKQGFISYLVAVDVAMKQQYMRVSKISTDLVVIDLSSNRFSGFIPRSISNLTSLHVVNLSSNAFGGKIPRELGQLAWIESLDLSWNHLVGEIPQELATVTTLAWLNLSYNDLSGRIPSGSQFSTFTGSSFQGGNKGLYGCPLLVKCNLTFVTSPSSSLPPPVREGSPFEDIMLWLFVGVGFGVGFALTIVLQVVCSGRREK